MGLFAALVAVFVSVLAVLGLGGAVLFYFANAPDEVSEWIHAVDFEVTPMAPIFAEEDTQQCKDLINQFYTDSTASFDQAQTNKATFDSIYATILANKALYDVNFVGADTLEGNAEFRDWVLGSDWYDFKDETTAVPAFNKAMEAQFGADAAAITEADYLQEAAWALVYYREGYGLESLIAYDEPHYPLEIFQACDIYTQLIGVAYANYLVRYCCDARPANLQPFLEHLGQFVLDQAD